ncbi:Oxidoreductase, short-chain dehydrogenase/reductase family [Candidatus Syntrophocurvum alkaliphilum]|uniref:Oxidoreductase, short-chain dehydrogenase/reductase family n=1 Tax=Candidatus Syntrophocurvum alkaliphilum TaxID=2293317 RepID=A0A6I6DG93_9FIRM|nr:SDR family NAD(P)-dependent oxidoreductase [Candidatus Syntrophocurvum alkaliphilum]QGT98699.1 Oxidoreductase, short-chain dehydrogenase/reductase family [Candidatus Syntrophocurvum alkaliphilum]
MEFKNKVALVTGAAGGIGEETIRLLIERGAKVSLVDLQQKAIDDVVAKLNLKEGDYITATADVSNEAEVQSFVKKTKDTFGRIDFFFNNAGIEGEFGLIKDTKTENIDKVFNVNVKGVYYGLKYVIPIMLEQKYGSIVNNASVAGIIGSPGMAPYVGSKHAVIGITKSAALEVAEFGVRVNAVCPGPINNRMMRSIEEGWAPGAGEQVKEQLEAGIPMKRYGESEEVAELVLFLASDRSVYITGVYYSIDGGKTAT